MTDKEIVVLEALTKVLEADFYQNMDFLAKKRIFSYISDRFLVKNDEKVEKNTPNSAVLEGAKKYLNARKDLKIGDTPPFGGLPITCNTEQ